jgi:hypothetical protein
MQPSLPPPSIALETRVDRLWIVFNAEREKAWTGDKDAAIRAGRLLSLFFDEFQHPAKRWPRHETGRLLTPSEIAPRGGLPR